VYIQKSEGNLWKLQFAKRRTFSRNFKFLSDWVNIHFQCEFTKIWQKLLKITILKTFQNCNFQNFLKKFLSDFVLFSKSKHSFFYCIYNKTKVVTKTSWESFENYNSENVCEITFSVFITFKKKKKKKILLSQQKKKAKNIWCDVLNNHL